MMREYKNLFFKKFGVNEYHDIGIRGSGTSVYVIDTGLSSQPDNTQTAIFSNGRSKHGSLVSNILSLALVPESKIYVADISDSNGKIYTSALTKAINDAVDLKVDIISISLGTNAHDVALEKAVNRASKEGILVFSASGNCSCRAYEYPAAVESVISVASMDLNSVPSSFNTRNDAVTVFAPGENIPVSGSKTRLSGTSFAVPFASGLAALELSRLRKYEGPQYKISKETMILKLRGLLGLNCDVHTYNMSTCLKTLKEVQNPLPRDGVDWLLALGLVGLLIISMIRFSLGNYGI